MKPKTIGIIGGAGPLAGAFFLERIVLLSGQKYGCYRDADYPEVILLSFPFSEMLKKVCDFRKIRQELQGCLEQLRRNGAAVIAIACNTLHTFLEHEAEASDLIHLPRTLAAEIPENAIPLILCTSTAARAGLHQNYFPCVYPDPATQAAIDEWIDSTLKGADRKRQLKALKQLIEQQKEETIILGCTELSLFFSELSQTQKRILDPLEISANKVLELSFN